MNRYLPFLSGVYTTAPGLAPLTREGKSGGDVVFDIDEHYDKYIANKLACRQEDISKYHATDNFDAPTRDAVNQFLVKRMSAEHPDIFVTGHEGNLLNRKTGEQISFTENESGGTGKYNSSFDALCCQLQEDVAVVQLAPEKDWLAAIHLCSPNHWDPRTKIGRPFNEIHAPVPEIARTVKNYMVMMRMVIDKGPFTRFAWGVATDDRLNHHPVPPPGADSTTWKGRAVTDETIFYVRAERQNLIGLASVNAFIFTIRTYFYPVSELSGQEKQALGSAVRSMTDASLAYKGMTALKELLLRRIDS